MYLTQKLKVFFLSFFSEIYYYFAEMPTQKEKSNLWTIIQSNQEAEEKSQEKVSESSEKFVLFVGQRSSGKSALTSNFINPKGMSIIEM